MPSRSFQAIAEAVNFFFQIVLSETCVFKFLICDCLPVILCLILDEIRKLVEFVTPQAFLSNGFRICGLRVPSRRYRVPRGSVPLS